MVIEDLFEGQMDEHAILKKHNIGTRVYLKWLSEESFLENFHARLESAKLQHKALIARCAGLAAARLVALTESQKEETARRACLDILQLATEKPDAVTTDDQQGQADDTWQQAVDPALASKILEALASEKEESSVE